MAEITKSLKETAGKITGGLGRGLSKLSSVFKSNKIEPAMSETSGSMSNTQYLGSIYQLMVDSDEERRLEYQRDLNLKEESDSEEQRQHQEIIKALTLRRVPKRKKSISKEQKQSEKVEKTAKSTVGKKTKKPKVPKKGEPAKKDEPAKKPTDAEKDKRKEQKSSAKDEQIKKDKKSADDAKAAADKKTADAKTSAQKKEADRAQEAAKKKADDAKAAEEAKKASDARRAADDASKKRIAEDRAKKEAETKAKKEAPKTEAPKKEVPKTEAPKKEAPKTEAPKKEAPKTAEPVKQTQKPPAPKPAEPVKAPETVKPPTATQKPDIVKPAITKAAKTATKVGISGSKGLVLATLVAAGYSTAAQANIMANVDKESGFNPRSEEVPKPAKIFSMFGPPDVPGGQPKGGRNKVRFPTLQDAENIVASGPESYFNKVYDGRMGNTTPGDGYKYRGRGFIQITGKDMYQRVGKMIGVNLVSNPDLANTPEIAAKIIPAFFKLKAKEKKISEDKYNEIDTVNEVVGFADKESRELRKKLSISYADQLNSLTKENKDMKVQDKPAPVNVQQNTTNVSNTSESSTPAKVDDRPAHKRK